MQELSDLMWYLDKTYKVGKPRMNFMNIPDVGDDALLLSDDLVMDFDLFGKLFGVSGTEVVKAYERIYDKMMSVRFNLLHMLCLGNIMRDPIVSETIRQGFFNDEAICDMVDFSLSIL